MSTPKKQTETFEVTLIDLNTLRPGHYNPRTNADKEAISDLTKSLIEDGLINPITVRPAPGKPKEFEIIAGHRRTQAWTKAFPGKPIPAHVVKHDDEKARLVSIVENIQREDLNPLDEARAYAEALKLKGMDRETLSAKCGKRPGHVHARLLLLGLGEFGILGLSDGTIPLTVANLIARIADEKDRHKASKQVYEDGKNGDDISPRAVRRYIAEEFERDLTSAPWPKDKVMVGDFAAPTCKACPYNSANQETLPGVEVLKGRARCGSATCFSKKAKKWGDKLIAEAKQAGLPVLEGQKATAALTYSSEYVKLDDECYNDARSRSWRDVLKGKDVKTIVAIRPEDGRAFQLVKQSDANAILTGQKRGESKKDPKIQAEKALVKKLKATAEEGLRAIAAKATQIAHTQDVPVLMFIGRYLLERASADARRIVAQRRKLPVKKSQYGMPDYHGALSKLFDGSKYDERVGLMLELIAAEEAGSICHYNGEGFREVLKFLAIDYKKLKPFEVAPKKEAPKKASKK